MSNKKTAVFPGSFDPITLGHENIIHRAVKLFDEVVVAIGTNSQKQTLFSLEQRKRWIEECFQNENKVSVATYRGLTVDFCKEIGADYIIRGIRSTNDFEYEKPIAQINTTLNSNVETIFFIAEPQHSAISSSIVRDIYRHQGDISHFVPFKIEK